MFCDEILNSLDEIFQKHRVFLVGGYLRNFFINNEISPDRDLVCLDSAYNLANEIAQYLDGTFIELDCENKIYRVVLKDKINYFDISQALENDILKDAKRRDFTINSIFWDLNKKEIFDPLDGISDIKNKIIKTCDLKNISDDFLRLLRIYRFKSQFNFNIDEKLISFALSNFHLIKDIALERINQEILKMFEGKYLCETLLEMFDDGILELVFPFVAQIKKIPSNSHHHLDLIHHSIETIKYIDKSKPLLRLAAFYHDIGKPSTFTIDETGRHRFIGHDVVGGELVKKELKELKFSKKQIEYISKMVRYHIYPSALINCTENNKKAFARFVKKIDKDTLDLIELAKADRLSARGVEVSEEMINKTLEHLDNLSNFYNEIKNQLDEPKMLLNGNEIMEILNIKPSKKIGEILDELKELQLSGEIKTKDEAIKFIKKQK